MFENHVFYRQNETYTHAQQPAVFAKLSVYVWRHVQNPSACEGFCDSSATEITEPHRFLKNLRKIQGEILY